MLEFNAIEKDLGQIGVIFATGEKATNIQSDPREVNNVLVSFFKIQYKNVTFIDNPNKQL